MFSFRGGYSRDGWEGNGALGYGWGTRDPGTCPGFTMTRVLRAFASPSAARRHR